MIIQTDPPQHLTYCLNIHPGESWAENLQAIQTHAVAVKQAVSPEAPFGLGLRLGYEAAKELAREETLAAFQETLRQADLYVFTINGFPYGQFHGTRVKEQVYAPDWTTPARRDYTRLLMNVLSRLVPDQVTGSISTVPLSFKPWHLTRNQVDAAVSMLADTVRHLYRIEQETGVYLHLGLEPEPACFLETTEECLAFFKDILWQQGRDQLAKTLGCDAGRAESLWRRHLGICFDSCHLAIQFEALEHSLDRLEAAGLLVSKIHLSAALISRGPDPRRALRPFEEPVYLHQVNVRHADHRISSWSDLPQALAAAPLADAEEWRVHFHVPLFWEGTPDLGTTARDLTPGFFSKIRAGAAAHLEIETYTFDVLPDDLRDAHVAQSIVREFNWVKERL